MDSLLSLYILVNVHALKRVLSHKMVCLSHRGMYTLHYIYNVQKKNKPK